MVVHNNTIMVCPTAVDRRQVETGGGDISRATAVHGAARGALKTGRARGACKVAVRAAPRVVVVRKRSAKCESQVRVGGSAPAMLASSLSAPRWRAAMRALERVRGGGCARQARHAAKRCQRVRAGGTQDAVEPPLPARPMPANPPLRLCRAPRFLPEAR